MKKSLFSILIAVLTCVVVFFLFSRNQPRPLSHEASSVTTSAAGSTNLMHDQAPTDTTNTNLASKLEDEPVDVLSATNLEQWKALIKDLNQDPALQRHWETRRFRPKTSEAALKHNGQTIIFEMKAVDVTFFSDGTNMMKADLYSPSMNIEQTRELGSQLSMLFGQDPKKFLNWCNTVSNTWLDAPLFENGDGTDQSHYFSVHTTYNNERPWYIRFTVQQESAIREWLRKSENE